MHSFFYNTIILFFLIRPKYLSKSINTLIEKSHFINFFQFTQSFGAEQDHGEGGAMSFYPEQKQGRSTGIYSAPLFRL